ncbi:glycosyltransferase family 9 protein [Synechococcus sp. CBW1006]|uniref:glycosyltransferase family 9 protein n=1 Tax=Synechococcus sp. CBW1006 TaxID=1353138 RepID=UPI0018CCB31B|nr:glycosyltransferase family 9 protein [Synechococcus sp. CBW1006]QPN65859.1 glycosyltransferase family 9 protein [Synechococcus sp. CBW1006]
MSLQRFENQPLSPRPRIVVLGAAKLGNYVVLQPLLRGLHEKYDGLELTYVGSRRTAELEQRNPWLHACLPLAERGAAAQDALRQCLADGPIDLVINADGHAPHTPGWVEALAPRYVVGAAAIPAGHHPLQHLAADPHWARPDLERRYAGWITGNSIRELHCRVAWVDTDFERVELPMEAPPPDLPAVLIAVNGERPAKLWPLSHWLSLLALMEQELGLSPQQIGLIGGPPPRQISRPGDLLEQALLAALPLRDLRGHLSLPRLVGALARSRLCIAVDAGPLHLAAAAGCPTVALFGTDPEGIGASPQGLWAPRSPTVWIPSSVSRCTLCHDEHYRNASCLRSEHLCMADLTPTAVWPLLEEAWSSSRNGTPGAAEANGPSRGEKS